MVFRVFSPTLDPSKKWYALNTSICGGPPRKFAQNEIFELFKGEVISRSISELKDNNGRRVSPKIFNAGKRETPNVYVGTTFAIVVGNIRRKNPSDSEFLCSTQFLRLKRMIDGEAIETEDPRPQAPVGFSWPSTPDTSFSDCSSSISLGDLSDLSTSGSAEDAKEKNPPSPKLAPKFSPPFSSSPLPMKRKSSNSILSDFSEETTDESDNYKRRKIREKASSLLNKVNSICDSNNEDLSSVIARCCLSRANEGSHIIKDVFTKVEKEIGVKKTFEKLIPDELWGKTMHSMTVPDWQLLLMKLEIPISDDGWQAILNRTHLGKCSRSSDSGGSVLLSKNSIKAMKSFVFEKVEGLFGIEKIKNEDIPGYQVGLEPVVCWQARELRLQGHCQNDIQLNLKLDGRPFGGRSQVLVGVIPTETVKWSNHSCKSFCPLAIANCKEDRVSLQQLISKLNREKDAVKRNGIRIDGQLLNVRFKVTLDLKALYLLLVKDDDENFKLGGKGLSVEFCFFCRALRNCKCDLGPDAVCLTHLSETKANIGSFKGIRDDLTFLLEEELTSINLCALHCELRNTEQLLGSLGLYAYRIGSLKECNAALAKYGPETSGDRIKIKMKEGQQTVVAKQNIQVTSFSGNTERNILNNIEEIVHESLPLESLKEQFRSPNLAKETILNKIAFCSQQIRHYEKVMKKETFTRDFGKYEEEIPLKGSVAYEKIVEYRNSWEKTLVEMKAKLEQYSLYLAVEGISQKRDKKKIVSQLDGLSEYAAQVTKEFYIKVFTSWREIAKIIRKGVFSKEQQHLIDEFDLQCKDWGFLLREMFGPLLGTGDYGHMTIEHSSMLLRVFGSIREYSNQSIEAAHSLQRQLYSKATSHDRHGYISSIRQLLLHFYSERILFLRLCFRNALQCTNQGDTPKILGLKSS